MSRKECWVCSYTGYVSVAQSHWPDMKVACITCPKGRAIKEREKNMTESAGTDREGPGLEQPCGTRKAAEVLVDAMVQANDPWKHRSKGMTCATCMWSVMKEQTQPVSRHNPITTDTPKLGRCRRHAPTMNGYPAIFPADWCGDHKLDENKI